MDRTAEREARQQLLRIAALLLALAALAGRACRAPLPVRFVVLVVLRPAESVARQFVAIECGLPLPAFAGEGFDAEAALCLAESFVALAIILAGFADWPGAGVRIGAAACRRVLVLEKFSVCGPEPADTS